MDTHHHKQKLEEEKKLLGEELKSIGVENPKKPGDWEADLRDESEAQERADRNVAADRFETYEEDHALTDTLEVRLKNVNDALARIENGTYGKCETGGEAIEEDRLEANPAARTCKKHLAT